MRVEGIVRRLAERAASNAGRQDEAGGGPLDAVVSPPATDCGAADSAGRSDECRRWRATKKARWAESAAAFLCGEDNERSARRLAMLDWSPERVEG